MAGFLHERFSGGEDSGEREKKKKGGYTKRGITMEREREESKGGRN